MEPTREAPSVKPAQSNISKAEPLIGVIERGVHHRAHLLLWEQIPTQSGLAGLRKWDPR